LVLVFTILTILKKDIQEVKSIHDKEIEDFKSKMNQLKSSSDQKLLEKDKEQATLTSELNNLRKDAAYYQQEILSLTQERDKLMKLSIEAHPLSNSASNSWNGPLTADPKLQRSPSALMGLEGGLSSFKQKELQLKIDQLTLLLTESEANVQKLEEQQKLLKDELRQDDRMERRKNLNIEYLKNIILSFFESSTREKLIPVMVQVLQLSPDEEQRLRTASGQTKSGFGFF
jgi:hypothetical protein